MTPQPDMFGVPDVGGERHEMDAYYTPPWATHALCNLLGRDLRGDIWEPCAGNGAIVDVLDAHPHTTTVHGSDIAPARDDIHRLDFLSDWGPSQAVPEIGPPHWIVTNPPYRTADGTTATDFVHASLDVAIDGVAMLLRLAWMEPCEDRADLWAKSPPTDVLVLPRVHYAGAPSSNNQTSAWFIWRYARRGGTHLVVYTAEQCRRWGRK